MPEDGGSIPVSDCFYERVDRSLLMGVLISLISMDVLKYSWVSSFRFDGCPQILSMDPSNTPLRELMGVLIYAHL
jgi:hypothetical protein